MCVLRVPFAAKPFPLEPYEAHRVKPKGINTALGDQAAQSLLRACFGT